ncbi:MAG: glycogen synthase GlgA [Chlamydiales bacterium]
MYIINIASELAPIAKVGGLADVIGGLSSQLSSMGHSVDIIIPKYDCMYSDGVQDLDVAYQELKSYYKGSWYSNTIWIGWVGSLKVYFVDPHHPRYFFDRGCTYGCDDDIERFLYFSRTAMEFLYKEGKKPDIIHIHDWQTAAIAPLYRDLYANWGFHRSKLIFTIHNIAYQGKCSANDLESIGLDGKAYLNKDKLQDNFQSHIVNLIKGGITFSDVVTTVSPSYARDILSQKEGQGLEETLYNCREKVHGILNGLDYNYWNPETDPHLPANYSSREIPQVKGDRNTLDKKAYVKKELREKLMLEELHRPIIGCIARLVPQKGLDLIKYAIECVVEKGGQFVFLGSGPIPSINKEFHELRHQYSDHPHISLILQHDETVAHRIYAASDMLLVPSLFEPCGLVQLIALRYGAVPIVHKTGGLSDTIIDVDNNDGRINEANGYLFEKPTPQAMSEAIERAISCWYKKPDFWRRLMIRSMNMDFSWRLSAEKYISLYESTK